MEPMARTRPNMSVLPGDILPVSPFGILSQAFTEEILARFESGPGMYPMYGLELLYPEEDAVETPPGGNVHLEIQLKLILQQLKKSGKTPAAERILERAETLRLLREKTVVRRTPGAAGKTAAGRMPAPDRTLSSRAIAPWPGAAGSSGRTAHGQSGVRRMAALAGTGRAGGGSDRPGMYAASAAGMGYRQPGTQAGAAADGGHRRPSPYNGAALVQMDPPTVAGLPGQMGRSPTEVRFLTPREEDAPGTQTMDRSKIAAALTRRMEQAAAQTAEVIARAMTAGPQGTQGDDHISTGMTADRASGRTVANHASDGTAVDRGFAGATASGGEMSGRHPSAKERTDSDPDIGRIGPAARDIRTGSGGQIGSLPDTGSATSGAVGAEPALRPDKTHGAEGVAAASGYLPVSLEHTEPAAISEQAAIPGQTTPVDEAGRRLAQAIEAAALGAERALAQPAGDSRREARPAAGRKSGSRDGAVPTQAEATAAFVSQPDGAADADGRLPVRMERLGPSAKGAEEAIERIAATAGQNWPAANSPGVLRGLEDLAVSSGAIGAENTELGVGGTLTAKEPVSTEQAGQPPLTLEFLQGSQKDDRQAAERMQAVPPEVLEKLLDTPGLRLLSKDIAVLTAESRGKRGDRQAPHRRSQAAQRTAGRMAQADGTVRGGTAYRGTSGAAGDVAFTKQSAVGYGDLSQAARLHGSPRSRDMGLPSVRASGTMTSGGMALLGAAAAVRSHIWSPSDRPPVELAHMEPSLEAQTAGPAAQAAARRETGAQQEALRKELQRSFAGGSPGAAASGQRTFQSQTGFEQRAFDRETAAGPTQAGRRGSATRGPGQLTAVGHMGGFSRGGRTRSDAPGAAAYGGMDQEALSAYPELSMEHGGPLLAMARELRQTAAREIGRMGGVRDMGLHGPAARAMEEKGAPETMQTLELMTQPQIQEQQVVWENPYLRSAPAEMAHHQKNDPQDRQRIQQGQPQLRMSDAELRRTADKVFKLVQEKIVNERRRIGRI